MADSTPQDARGSRTFGKSDGVALREHLEAAIAAQKCYFEARILALEKANEVAARALAERLASLNEFKEAMNDLQGRMATRDEVRLQLGRITDDINDLKRSRDENAGKASQTSVLISMLFGLAGIVFGIVNLLIP